MLAETISFQICRSRQLFFLLIFIYGGAGFGVLLLSWNLWWRIFLLFFCLSTFAYQYWRYIFFHGGEAYVNLTCIGDDRWSLCNQKQHKITVVLQKSSVIWSRCIILHFREENSRYFYAVVIFSDAMSPQDFRRLKVCVRTG